MSASWYYASNGKQMDPVSMPELQRLAANGHVKPTDLVWHEGMASWVKASTVANLFPAAAPATAVTPKRAMAAAVAKPAALDEPEVVREEAEDRPSRRRRRDEREDDDDEDGDRPRRRRRRRDEAGGVGLKIALIGGGVALVLVLVVVLVIVAVRSGGNNLKVAAGATEVVRYTVDMQPAREEFRNVQLKTGHSYEVQLKSDGRNDVDLVVRSPNGQVVGLDETVGPDGNVRFLATMDGQYSVGVRNLDGSRIRSHVLVSQLPGGPVPIAPPNPMGNVPPFNPPVFQPPVIQPPPTINPPLPKVGGSRTSIGRLNPGQRFTVARQFRPGQQVRVRVESTTIGEADVDLYVKHNNFIIEKDDEVSAQCSVQFNARIGVHQIEVVNIGPGAADCTLFIE